MAMLSALAADDEPNNPNPITESLIVDHFEVAWGRNSDQWRFPWSSRISASNFRNVLLLLGKRTDNDVIDVFLKDADDHTRNS